VLISSTLTCSPGKGNAIQRGADLNRLRPEDEIHDQAMVVHVAGGEGLVGRVEIAAIPDQLDRLADQRFVG